MGTRAASSVACAASSSSTVSKPPGTSRSAFSPAADMVQNTISASASASASSARVSERARPRGSALLGKLASAFRTRWHSRPARSYEQMTPASASPLRCSTCSACLIPKPADQPQTGQDKLDSAASSRERSRAWPSRRARSAAHAAACLACSLSSRHFACRSWSAPPWAKVAWRTSVSRCSTSTSRLHGDCAPREPSRTTAGVYCRPYSSRNGGCCPTMRLTSSSMAPFE
mmetsp:Transcript_38699/g.121939  ORF Transcript_38699/g.121939 Transcript_38699/m.121939 type:complete len:230 (+) Transcript_38699:130-819(+)